MPPNFFPAYSIFFMIMLVPVPRVVCQDNQQSQYECGNVNISYPFWGGDRLDYCGHPAFELTCDGEAPAFTMKNVSYRVLDIDNSSNIVTVTRADYWDSNCPRNYVNTTLDATLFSYNTSNPEVTLYYYECAFALGSSKQFNCSNIICYYTTRDLNLGISIGSCGVNVTVPIFQSAATAIESGGGTVDLLRTALKGGFGLEWNANNSLCEECVESGGQCGYYSTSNQFKLRQYYARNGPPL